MAQARRWCFKLNNPDDSDDGWLRSLTDAQDRAYLIVGREVGASGTPHIQGYITFYKPKRFAAVKLISPTAHWEKAKGNTEQNIAYCSKDGDFTEFGERPKVGRTASFNDAVDMIVAGNSIHEIAVENPVAIARGGRGLRDLSHVLTNEDEEEEKVEMNEAWHLLKECDRVPAAAIPTTSQPTTTSTEDRARINFSPIPYANSTHATSPVVTKEIFDLCSPERTAREENTNASPDFTIVKAKLKVAECKREEAECKREEAELMLTLAQMEAKANTGPTKKRADDNISNMSNGGEPKRVKVEEEVKVKIEEEWTP